MSADDSKYYLRLSSNTLIHIDTWQINSRTNQEGSGKSETTVGKILARRIYIDLPGKVLSHPCLTSFFEITFQIMSKPTFTRKNRFRLVKYSCAEVSGSSEVPRFVRELNLKVIKEVQLICARSIISCSQIRAIV